MTKRKPQPDAVLPGTGGVEAAPSDIQRSERVQAALYRIAETASVANAMEDFYAAIQEIVAGLMYGDNFYIALYDDERDLVNFTYYRDSVDTEWPEPGLWESVGSGTAAGLTALVLRTREVQHVPRARWLEMIEAGVVGHVGAIGEDWLGVPLTSGGRTVGVLVVQTYEPGQHYTDDDVRILSFVGQHIATALTHAQAIDEVRHRNAELAAVNEIGKALVTQRDFQAVIEAVGDRAADALGVRGLSICIVDPKTKELTFFYWVDDGVRNRAKEGIVLGDPLSAEILSSGRPLRIGSAEEAAARGTPFAVGGTESYLGVPIPAGDRTIGVFALGTDERHAYRDTHERLLTTMASAMGVGLENARLFAETTRLLAETNDRAAELAIVNGVQMGLAAQLDMQAMYDLVGDKLQEIFEAQVVDIGILDRDAGQIRFPYTIERGVRFPDEPMPVIGFRRLVIESGEPMVINEGAAARAIELGQEASIQGEPAKSLLFAPLVLGSEVRGVISLQNLDHEHAFDDRSLRLLTTLTASLSVALENARLLEETRQRAAELLTVNEVGQAVASQLDLDALIDLVGEKMREVFNADIVYVAMLNETTQEIEFPYHSENGRKEPQPTLRLGEGLTSQILQSARPLLLNQDAQFSGIERPVGTLAKSYLGVPILVGERAIGVISVQSTAEAGRFGEDDARLLSTLAASVGAAIQNARLVRAQKQSEEEYRRLVEELPLAIYTDYPDETSTSKYISPGVVAMFGYSIEEWLQPAFFTTVIHPADRDRVMGETTENLAGSDQKSSYVYRVIAADGRTVWVRDDSWIFRSPDGTPEYVQGFMLDITEQTLAAAEIRRQKQYFEALVEISPVAIATMDRDEIVSAWNPAATRLFGYEPDEAIGRHVDDLLFLPDEREQGEATTRLADESGRAQLIGQRRRKDGALVDVEIVLVPLVVDGEHTGYYAIYHDITELQAARRDADSANEAKSTFLASMSHEIRTPMNAIIGMSGLLVDTKLDAEQRDFAETIRTSGEALLTIINDILDFSKIEAGRLELEAQRFELATTIEGALDMMGPLAAGKGLELAYSIDPNLPASFVGDGGRLRQIVLNLLSNAVKFTDTGDIVVTVGGSPAGQPSANGPQRWDLTVSIADTGIGIPADRMDRLFRSFSQADASISRRYGGTGLGLAISRRLAELMSGSLVAHSSGIPGEGSTFTLAIRLAESSVSAGDAAPPPDVELSGRRALVVDDNATNLRILVDQLERLGLEVTSTTSPTDARDLATGPARFDVVLTDLQMPGLDGLELAAAVRAGRPDEAPPIVVLSSVGHRERHVEGIEAFLTKPVKPAALRDALVRALGGTDPRPAPAPAPRFVADPELGVRHPLRVLLAEDNAVNQKLALRLLRGMGYEADLAVDGLKVLDALERQDYDLVLMDVQMPDLDGLEATRRIRHSWPDRPLRIVAMTANAMEGDREACLAAGMDDYLSKPIRPHELAAALVSTPSQPVQTPEVGA